MTSARPLQIVDGEGVADELRAAFRHHPAGVAVVTADAGDGPAGLTATSVVSLSVDPPLIGFSLSSLSSAAPTIIAAESVGIHLVDRNSLSIAQRFATSNIDRFADREGWSYLPTGEPILHDVRRWMRGRVRHRVTAGGATVVIAEVVSMSVVTPSAGDALVYHDRSWHALTAQSRLD